MLREIHCVSLSTIDNLTGNFKYKSKYVKNRKDFVFVTVIGFNIWNKEKEVEAYYIMISDYGYDGCTEQQQAEYTEISIRKEETRKSRNLEKLIVVNADLQYFFEKMWREERREYWITFYQEKVMSIEIISNATAEQQSHIIDQKNMILKMIDSGDNYDYI